MNMFRVWLADRLILWSQRLDPNRPETRALSNGQVQVHFQGVPLANVTVGNVPTMMATSMEPWK